jgi:hypothetical protein
MEEFQEADILWPETPPPSRDRESYPPELHEAIAAAADFSCESFGSDMSGPASSSSSSASSSAPAFGRRSSDGFLSDPSAFAGGGGHGGNDASFLEADVLWPDDGYATREGDVDGGELWWRLCCGISDDAAAGRGAEPAAASGKRGPWRAPLVSSPIDIPTGGAATTAYRRRRPTISIGGLSQAQW